MKNYPTVLSEIIYKEPNIRCSITSTVSWQAVASFRNSQDYLDKEQEYQIKKNLGHELVKDVVVFQDQYNPEGRKYYATMYGMNEARFFEIKALTKIPGLIEILEFPNGHWYVQQNAEFTNESATWTVGITRQAPLFDRRRARCVPCRRRQGGPTGAHLLRCAPHHRLPDLRGTRAMSSPLAGI